MGDHPDSPVALKQTRLVSRRLEDLHEKAVLIGAGSAFFTQGIVADLIERNQECELALVDIDPDALDAAERISRKIVEKMNGPVRVSATTDRREALPGATAVISTIAVGGREGRLKDVVIPRKYGAYSSSGDTAMPAGASRALRMIPATVSIAEDVLDLAPDALFFNYGNPMTAVCRGVRKATGANVIGMCHGVKLVGEHLAWNLGIDKSRVTYDAVGINHFTWFTAFRVDGVDAMPRLREIAKERIADPEAPNPFCWRLLDLFGAFPAVLDVHVTEFFPYLFPNGMHRGKQLGVDIHSIERNISQGDTHFERMREEAHKPGPLSEDYVVRTVPIGEDVIPMIDSIRADARRIFWANVPNTGQAPNLPIDAVIECAVIADGSGLRPIAMPPLPSGLAGTLARPFAWVEVIVEAALEGSREKFIQSLLMDGAVNSIDTAVQLAHELLEAHAEHLPQFAPHERAS